MATPPEKKKKKKTIPDSIKLICGDVLQATTECVEGKVYWWYHSSSAVLPSDTNNDNNKNYKYMQMYNSY